MLYARNYKSPVLIKLTPEVFVCQWHLILNIHPLANRFCLMKILTKFLVPFFVTSLKIETQFSRKVKLVFKDLQTNLIYFLSISCTEVYFAH